MGQGAGRLAEQGLALRGRGEDGAWLVEVRRQPLRVFGEGLEASAASSSAPESLFVEVPDNAGPAVTSAVSELNALLAEKRRSLEEALRLLDRLLRDAHEEGQAQLARGEEEDEDDSEEEVVIDLDSGLRAEDAGCSPLGQPQVHEASVLPSAGLEEELDAAMWRLVEAFARAGAGAGGPALARAGAAALALRHCRWDDAEALRRLQANADVLLAEVGVAAAVSTADGGRCGVCFDELGGELGSGLSMGCGHFYCWECWRRQLETVAKGGAGGGAKVLDAKCPSPSCGLRVCLDVFDLMGLDSLASLYKRMLLRSFLEESGSVVECPGCGRHVLLGPSRPDAGPCRHCARRFCSLCFKEAHGPLTCAERRTWLTLVEDAKQSVVQKWASRLANFLQLGEEESTSARRCPNPQCNVMSQKIEGCLFLTCPRCGESWCWNCGNWGGGPSGRPRPHHVFVCTDYPTDMTWLDGHASLQEDAHFTFHRALWDERSQTPEEQPDDGVAKPEESAAADLAAAAAEARGVLAHGAAWRFFERDDARRRLFEFAEADLEKLLGQLGRGPEEWEQWRHRSAAAAAAEATRRARTLAGALRTQAQALRSYRREGGV